jgi:hypothetical protein
MMSTTSTEPKPTKPTKPTKLTKTLFEQMRAIARRGPVLKKALTRTGRGDMPDELGHRNYGADDIAALTEALQLVADAPRAISFDAWGEATPWGEVIIQVWSLAKVSDGGEWKTPRRRCDLSSLVPPLLALARRTDFDPDYREEAIRGAAGLDPQRALALVVELLENETGVLPTLRFEDHAADRKLARMLRERTELWTRDDARLEQVLASYHDAVELDDRPIDSRLYDNDDVVAGVLRLLKRLDKDAPSAALQAAFGWLSKPRKLRVWKAAAGHGLLRAQLCMAIASSEPDLAWSLVPDIAATPEGAYIAYLAYLRAGVKPPAALTDELLVVGFANRSLLWDDVTNQRAGVLQSFSSRELDGTRLVIGRIAYPTIGEVNTLRHRDADDETWYVDEDPAEARYRKSRKSDSNAAALGFRLDEAGRTLVFADTFHPLDSDDRIAKIILRGRAEDYVGSLYEDDELWSELAPKPKKSRR